jgi:hypothetical protein
MGKITLVVMAAGIGSRYGGLKQIDPVGPGGEIIIDYAIYDAIRAGFDEVVFIIRREIEEDFHEAVGETIRAQIPTRYVYQELDDLPAGFQVPEGRSKPWGTAHAVLTCKDVVDSPFGVINADDFYGRGAFKVLADFLREQPTPGDVPEYALVGYILGNTLSEHGHVARGVCEVSPDGYLEHIVERTKIKKFGEKAKFTEDNETWHHVDVERVVSMNMWGFTPALFGQIEERFSAFLEARGGEEKSEYLLPDVVGELVREQAARVRVLPCGERWFGVTYREDKPVVAAAVRELVERGDYPHSLWGD